MKQVILETSLIGCVDGCIHRLPNTEKESIRKNDRYGYESYRLIEITPHCSKSAECATRRQEIYARAESKKDEMYLTLTARNVSGKSAWRRACKAWDVITSEYRDNPCPFFSK